MHPSLGGKQTQVLKSVKDPDYILRGKGGEPLAVLRLSIRYFLVVVYKEVEDDGFIITAYETTDTFGYLKRN